MSSQILVNNNKSITSGLDDDHKEFLKAFAPTWYKIMSRTKKVSSLAKTFTVNNVEISLDKTDRCIIAEINGWSMYYFVCQDCNKLMDNMHKAAKANDRDKFLELLNDCVYHCEDDHEYYA